LRIDRRPSAQYHVRSVDYTGIDVVVFEYDPPVCPVDVSGARGSSRIRRANADEAGSGYRLTASIIDGIQQIIGLGDPAVVLQGRSIARQSQRRQNGENRDSYKQFNQAETPPSEETWPTIEEWCCRRHDFPRVNAG